MVWAYHEFVNDKSLKKIFILCGKKSFATSGAELLFKKIISEKEINLQMIDSYNEGLKLLESGDGLSASNKFNEAELLYPQSIWAPRS